MRREEIKEVLQSADKKAKLLKQKNYNEEKKKKIKLVCLEYKGKLKVNKIAI